MKIVVDEAKCQGFGLCKLAAPHLFEVGQEDGYAFALIDEVPPGEGESAEAAARQCPMDAITLDDH